MIFWSNSTNPVLKIPAILKFSCFGNIPRGVDTKEDDIKLILSPLFKLRLKASSDPIKILFFLNSMTSPLTRFLFKNSLIFFSLLLTPFKIIPFALSLIIIIPSPE